MHELGSSRRLSLDCSPGLCVPAAKQKRSTGCSASLRTKTRAHGFDGNGAGRPVVRPHIPGPRLRLLGAALLALARCRLVFGAALFMSARFGLLSGIVSDVPAASLQVKSSMGNQLVQATFAARTLAEWRIGKFLERFCDLPAGTASILVNRHDASPPRWSLGLKAFTT